MAGTKDGARMAVRVNKKKYGKNFYKKIGAIGGKKSHPDKGFGSMDKKKHREASVKGGTISRRRPKK